MTIGELAKSCGISSPTIRYYEKLGLLISTRCENNYRTYSEDELLKLELIKNAKKLGFTLAEIKDFLKTLFSGKITHSELKTVVQEKIHEIDRKITDLKHTKENLISLIEKCPVHSHLIEKEMKSL
jgi:MerR family copper efflux transcriptional regulator